MDNTLTLNSGKCINYLRNHGFMVLDPHEASHLVSMLRDIRAIALAWSQRNEDARDIGVQTNEIMRVIGKVDA